MLAAVDDPTGRLEDRDHRRSVGGPEREELPHAAILVEAVADAVTHMSGLKVSFLWGCDADPGEVVVLNERIGADPARGLAVDPGPVGRGPRVFRRGVFERGPTFSRQVPDHSFSHHLLRLTFDPDDPIPSKSPNTSEADPLGCP